MSSGRQHRRPADERFFMVRSLCSECAAGLRTTSPTAGWHRLIAASSGVLIVRTPDGQWSTSSRGAVWIPDGVRAELEACTRTSLRILYIRSSNAAWARGGTPARCGPVDVAPLLLALIDRAVDQAFLDRRQGAHAALAALLLHEIRAGVRDPRQLVWPHDPRIGRVAALVRADPGDARDLAELCRGGGVSVRTAQRLFPAQTGLTFERWRSRARLLHAERLLAEGRKVGEVAARCGYRSPSAFVAAFARHAGTTPGRFRRTSGG